MVQIVPVLVDLRLLQLLVSFILKLSGDPCNLVGFIGAVCLRMEPFFAFNCFFSPANGIASPKHYTQSDFKAFLSNQSNYRKMEGDLCYFYKPGDGSKNILTS